MFCNTFCKGQGLERTADDSIWDLIVSFNMYDPMALLCAVDSTRCYFKPTVKRVLGVDHLVVGTSKDDAGVDDDMVEELRDFMYTNFFKGITLDFSEFEGTFEAVEHSEQLGERQRRNEKAEAYRATESSDNASMVSDDDVDARFTDREPDSSRRNSGRFSGRLAASGDGRSPQPTDRD